MTAKRKRRKANPNPISAAKRRAPREDMRSVVINARMRHHGLQPDQASHERAGTALGRVFLAGKIDDTLYRAGEEYKRLHDAYMRSQNVPDGLAVSDCGDGGAEVSQEYEDWVKRTKAQWLEVKGGLRDASAWNAVVTESLVLKDATQADTHIQYAIAGLRFLSKKLGIST